MDPMERGTLAHRILERIDFAGWRRDGEEAIERVLRDEGLPSDRDAAEVRGQVAAFLRGRFGRVLAELGAGKIEREVPFALALGGERTRLLLKGQIDLVLFDDDGGVTVLDYKLAKTSDKRDYGFQLMAYAAAARALWGRNPRTGLVFLGDREPAPRMMDVTGAELDAFLAKLEESVAAMAEARRVERWQGRDVDVCRTIRCGYVARCHPSSKRG
jgi:ATP-dependent exoDNAse (exonuclease V) beta subunit